MRYSDLTSEELWKQFLLGDCLALDAIVKRHYNLLYQYGTKFTRDTGLVKDCIQDTFLFLWQKRSAINETPSVEHYLMKSLRRRLQRALSKIASFTENIGFLEFLDTATTPDHRLIQQEQNSELSLKIKKAIAALSKRQQEIIYLRFYLNADAAAIADIMQINRQSVYNLLYDAINQLRAVAELYFKPVIGLAILGLLILHYL